MDPTIGRPRKNLRPGKPRITPEQDAYNRQQVKMLASTGSTLEEAVVVLPIREVWHGSGRTFGAC